MTLAVISFELRVEALMPFIVAHSVVSFLRRRAYTKKYGDSAAEQRDDRTPDTASRLAWSPTQIIHEACPIPAISSVNEA
jgi:hypothetical protein